MKTYQLILAAALIALTACNKNDVETKINAESNNEIGFNTVVRKATKANDAIITDATYPTDNSFKVWGWQSAGELSAISNEAASNFMPGVEISYTKGTDETRAIAWRNAEHYYYWPFTGNIGFLAIHPSSVTPTSAQWDADHTMAKATIEGYTISSTNKTTDLMLGYAAGSKRTTALPLTFYHALSQIEVKVKTDEDYSNDVVFDVESVTFHNIDLSGNLSYENGSISWSANAAQTEEWVYSNTVKENITDEYQVYGAANVMIPQAANVKNLEAEPADNEETTITIGYSMTQTGSSKLTGTVNISKPQIWEVGKKYIYTINFKLNEILFNPDVNTWVVVNVDEITID